MTTWTMHFLMQIYSVLWTLLLRKSCIGMFIHQRRPELKGLLHIVLECGWAWQWSWSVGIAHFYLWLKCLQRRGRWEQDQVVTVNLRSGLNHLFGSWEVIIMLPQLFTCFTLNHPSARTARAKPLYCLCHAQALLLLSISQILSAFLMLCNSFYSRSTAN